MSPMTTKEVAGYQGKNIEVWVFNSANESKILRGAQNFNTTEEQAESRVPEMGFDATKVIYGSSSYSGSASLLVRDLVQIARLCGLDPDTAKRINVNEFVKVNVICWYKDPDTGTIDKTKFIGGFKARTASTSQAVDANAAITVDGGADLVATVDGKAKVMQFEGDGTTNAFVVPGDSEDDILLVESPAGQIEDGYTVSTTATPGSLVVSFDDGAPEDGATIRIVYVSA